MSPLKNKTILLTRDEAGAASFAQLLAETEARTVQVPLLAIDCIKQADLKVDFAECDWAFFTSQHGVRCFLQDEKLKASLDHCRIAAVGTKTAQALEKNGYTVDFIPTVFNAETMAKEFLATEKSKKPVLFVRGVIASPVLLEAFTKAGRPYHCVEVYDTIIHPAAKENLQKALEANKFDYLTFTSPSAIKAFAQSVRDIKQYQAIPTVCIGRTTQQAALNHGFTETIVPREFTTEAMVEAMKIDSTRKGNE